MNSRWLRIVGTLMLAATALSGRVVAQTERGPYARIAIMRPLDGHSVEWEAGYVRHLEWHRQVLSRMTVETLNLRPTMLVNVTPEPPRQ